MWDQRYSTDEFVYGTVPNEFLRSVVNQLPGGKALCLAAGEGRNAVYLAEQGFEVTAVDSSSVGLQKAQRLAEQRNVQLTTVNADLADFQIQPQSWDVITSIFCHLSPNLRQTLHRNVVAGLRSGGVFVSEVYAPEQLNYGTGGPPTLDLLISLKTLTQELAGLDLHHAQEVIRDVQEGSLHNGQSAVAQVLGFKPKLSTLSSD